MRKPKLTGVYYSSAPTLINKQLKEAFSSSKGPGDMPAKPRGKLDSVRGIIVPMYKYEEAAPCAAWAYKALAESDAPDVYIIIGQSSKGSGITIEPYETPYGIVRVDQKMVQAITAKGTISINNPLFDDDESIESQLPFLQFIAKSDAVKIVPVLVSHDTELKKLAVDIKEVLLETNKKAAIIVPSNFTSYGANHAYVPFQEHAHKKVYEMDKEAIDLIAQNKPLEYLKFVDDKAMNTNNFLGITLAMLILKPAKTLLEQYYTTADLNKDYNNFVSFASIVLK